jgi:hypothetical protein
MSKREREAERRLGLMPKLQGSKVKGGARAAYWTTHEKPAKKKRRGTGLEHRLRKDDASLLQKIHALGSKSDSVVLREKPEDLVRNLAFVQHQQKLSGAIKRLAKVQRGSAFAHDPVASVKGVYVMANGDWSHSLPKRVETIVQKTAFVTTEKR